MSMCWPQIRLFTASTPQKLISRLVIIRILVLLLAIVPLTGQENRLVVMTWNLLNFPDHYQGRIADIGLVLGGLEPDILVVNEMKSSSGVSLLYNQVLQPLAPVYAQGPFVANDYQNNAIFYNSERLSLLGSVTIPTALRDINGYTFHIEDHADTTFTFTIFAAHLKAGNPDYDLTDSQKRWQECKQLQAYIGGRDSDFHYAFAGDFNFYTADEPGYSLLMDSMAVDLEDPIDSPGVWHYNDSFSFIHTQSTRVPDIGDGGSTSGMDDRFDFILLSHHMLQDSEALSYIAGSYQAYGNDGLHYDKSINDPPGNAFVPANIADALYGASDHLPVLLQLAYPSNPLHAVRDNADDDLPLEYRLFANYPNPFNSTTTIRYNLPVDSHVGLIVYDLLGRELVRLVDEWRPAGSHYSYWSDQVAGNPELPSGIYIARLATPKYTKSIKMVLLK
ncbi:endonuclease/exonuclease/phosphatase family protein [Candidatus Neomarinimicrobiota bacterium]